MNKTSIQIALARITGLAPDPLDDNFLRVCREKLLTTLVLQAQFVRHLEQFKRPDSIFELIEYDAINSTPEQQATVLIKMFSTKTPITGEVE